MHLIIPYAACPFEGCLAAQKTLKLPHLHTLLKTLQPLALARGDESSLSMPFERAQAQALALPDTDGQIPLAALQARRLQIDTGHSRAFAFISLCHWQLNSHQIVMGHLPLAGLTAAESDDLLEAMRPYFAEDGILLHADVPGRWLAQADVLAASTSASTDRVMGRDLQPWLQAAPSAGPLRRLQNEMQMLLYTHPLHDARVAAGLPPVNSFWLSGSGALPEGWRMPEADLQPLLPDALCAPALAQDGPAWAQAWQALDASYLRTLLQACQQGQAVQLTLCGERSSQSWHSRPRHWPVWQQLRGWWGARPLSDWLKLL